MVQCGVETQPWVSDIYCRLAPSLAMKRKALVVRNGSVPESEDVVREQDELSSTSSGTNSQDEAQEREAVAVKKYVRAMNCPVFAAGRRWRLGLLIKGSVRGES